MAANDESVTVLSNGVKMPTIGFGLAFGNWADRSAKNHLFTPEDAWSAVPSALRAGYKHFDTAYVYGTHKILGVNLGMEMAKGVKRSEFFITTKVFHPPAPFSLNAIEKSMKLDGTVDVKQRTLIDFEKSLDELNLGYVDLLLMHWPGQHNSTDAVLNRRLRKECWSVFEEIYKSGKARAIGVSNFLVHHFETFLEDVTILPMCNQIEVSPYMIPRDTLDYCTKKNIAITSWGPFGSGATGVLTDPVMLELSTKYGKNVGQVILRWLVQQNISVLPKSSSEHRMASNLNIFDFKLDDVDMVRISNLNKGISSAAVPDTIA